MARRLSFLALALALVTAPLAANQATQSPTPTPAKPAGMMAAIQGTWQMTSNNGQDMTGSGQDILITITDNKYVQTVNGEVVERGTFKLDDTKKPATLDLTILEGNDAGQSQLGVVDITAKTMTGKLTEPGGTVRPADFAPADGYFTFTMIKK